ncbi:MAG: T9SS type A sorting domain-containing protein [Bacteroidales bacterium]|nr:T9SS type A sorting domain-containing protein [Bacteroidales bacterium]
MKKILLSVCCVIGLFLSTDFAQGQILLTSMDESYTLNFDSWGDNTVEVSNNGPGLPGFYSYRTLGNVDPQEFRRSTLGVSTSNVGRFYNSGVPDADLNANERACVLAYSSASGSLTVGLRFKNNTGTTITSLDVSFWGEQWRKGGSATTMIENTLEFEYLQAALIEDISAGMDGGVYTIVTDLNFVSPNIDPTVYGTAINGNLTENRTLKSATIAVNIPAGEEVMIRWIDRTDDSSFDHQMGIDDVVVTPRSTITSSNDILVRKPGVVVFPNPASEVLTIDASESGAEFLSVYDVAGRRVMSGNTSWGSGIGQLYIGNLPAGIYTMEVRSASGRTSTTRFVKK